MLLGTANSRPNEAIPGDLNGNSDDAVTNSNTEEMIEEMNADSLMGCENAPWRTLDRRCAPM